MISTKNTNLDKSPQDIIYDLYTKLNSEERVKVMERIIRFITQEVEKRVKEN